MSRRGKKLLIAVLLLAVAGYFGYNYLYQDHRDIQSEESALEISSSDLLDMFKANDTPEILNGTITVTGTITQTEANAVVLDESVHCTFAEGLDGLSVGSSVKIKGRCIGYDDLFEIVKLDQSSVLK